MRELELEVHEGSIAAREAQPAADGRWHGAEGPQRGQRDAGDGPAGDDGQEQQAEDGRHGRQRRRLHACEDPDVCDQTGHYASPCHSLYAPLPPGDFIPI